MKRILWIGEVFEDKDVYVEKAISLAANRWQLGFITSLRNYCDSFVYILGRLPRQTFPKGKLFSPKKSFLERKIKGKYFGYLNIYGIRNIIFRRKYYNKVKSLLKNNEPFDFIIVYNLEPYLFKTLLYIKKKKNIPIYAMIADIYKGNLRGYHKLAKLCDKIFYLSYGFYKESNHPHAYFFEGGFEKYKINMKPQPKKKVLLYTGSLGPHGGIDVLLDGFVLVKNIDAELWICGKGKNEKLAKLVNQYSNIKYFGVVSEEKLQLISNKVYAFVNPRPPDFKENNYNFPSKILEYFSYQKIIISTKTKGLSPEYDQALEYIEELTPKKIAETIERILNFNDAEYSKKIDMQKIISSSKLWENQIEEFLNIIKI